jgi:hypothetical protein
MIRCEQCFEDTGKEIYFDKITYAHLRFTHDGMTNSEYEMKFPDASMEDEELTARRAESTSLSNKGREFSEEHKEALSRGSTGKVLSEEHKRHIGESGEGRVFTDEHKENLSNSVNKFWDSEEGELKKKEMSENSQGRVFTDEHRKHISEAKEGVPLSESHREAISIGQTGLTREFTDEHRQALSAAKAGVPLSEDHAQAIGDSHLGMTHSEDTKKQMRTSRQSYLESEEGQLQTAKSIRENRGIDPNKEEQEVAEFLDFYFPGQFTFTGNGSLLVGSMCPDFANTSTKKIIEYFGSNWHLPGEEGKRVPYFKERGYDTLIVRSEDLYEANRSSQGLNKLLKRIAKFTGYTPKELL